MEGREKAMMARKDERIPKVGGLVCPLWFQKMDHCVAYFYEIL